MDDRRQAARIGRGDSGSRMLLVARRVHWQYDKMKCRVPVGAAKKHD